MSDSSPIPLRNLSHKRRVDVLSNLHYLPCLPIKDENPTKPIDYISSLLAIYPSTIPFLSLSSIHNWDIYRRTYLLLYGLPFFCMAYPLHSTIVFSPMISISSISIFNGVANAFTRGARIFCFQDSTFYYKVLSEKLKL